MFTPSYGGVAEQFKQLFYGLPRLIRRPQQKQGKLALNGQTGKICWDSSWCRDFCLIETLNPVMSKWHEKEKNVVYCVAIGKPVKKFP